MLSESPTNNEENNIESGSDVCEFLISITRLWGLHVLIPYIGYDICQGQIQGVVKEGGGNPFLNLMTSKQKERRRREKKWSSKNKGEAHFGDLCT